ncbi:MAG: hypothetical protein PF637_06085 [Spirochaetes bacterium]|nr:hypothetical protein [Spirochaetota bacterium]
MSIEQLASLGQYTSQKTGRTKKEIEASLYSLFMQTKGLSHYAREDGGSFSLIENDNDTIIARDLCIKNFIESVFRLNQRRNMQPFIVIGYQDVEIYEDKGRTVFSINWRLLDDLSVSGSVTGDLYE